MKLENFFHLYAYGQTKVNSWVRCAIWATKKTPAILYREHGILRRKSDFILNIVQLIESRNGERFGRQGCLLPEDESFVWNMEGKLLFARLKLS